MLFFGHLGLSLALVFITFMLLKDKADYRWVLLGALLPDIIDKPVGNYVFYEIFHNGRIFSHTILFIGCLAAIAYLLRKKTMMPSFLALGAVLHITEDGMWNTPQTLLWPAMGLSFPSYEFDNYAVYLLDKLTKQPDVYIPEILGALIVLAFILRYRVYKPQNLRNFVLTGRVGQPA